MSIATVTGTPSPTDVREWMVGPAVFSPRPGQFYRIEIERLMRSPRLVRPMGLGTQVFFLSLDVLTALASAFVIFLACAVDATWLVPGGAMVAALVLIQRQLAASLIRRAANDTRHFTYLYRAGLICRLP